MTTTPVVPHDLDLEQSVLAELAEPLHRIHALAQVEPVDFYSLRHRMIAEALRAGGPVHDDGYLADAIGHAWPICRGDLDRFFELSRRRTLLHHTAVLHNAIVTGDDVDLTEHATAIARLAHAIEPGPADG